MKTSRLTPSEMRLPLEPARGELVRAFVREACLCEGVHVTSAGPIANDTADAWQVLCTLTPGRERARIQVLCSGNDVSSRVILPSDVRANLVRSLAGRLREDVAISWRERGIDACEICLRRSLSEQVPPAPAAEEPAAAAEASPPAYTIDIPRADDALAIAHCFLAVYGHTYVHPEVFSPHRYWGKVERGEIIPVVARTSQGDVVGHLALERGPGTQVAERGEAVVLPAHRRHGLLEGMTERLSEEAVKHGLIGIYAEPVTIHTYSQRSDERARMPVCAVLLEVNPENFHPKDVPGFGGQRQSYLRTFRFVRPPTGRSIYAPAPYREVLRNIYESLAVPVTEFTAAGSPAQQSRTSIRVNGRGYGVIAFEQIGSQAPAELGQALRDARSLGVRSVQLSAPLDDPGLALLTGAARDLGFFFCGMGPAFGEGRDLLLLQYLSEPLDTSKLQLFTQLAKDLVTFIDSDRDSVPHD